MKHTMILVALIVALAQNMQAQAEFDVQRVAQNEIIGTARFIGMSGAFGSLGGDMSSLSINPAGIGIYRSSELSFSPSFQNAVSTSTLGTTTSNGTNLNLLVNGFGWVGTLSTYDETSFANINFGVTYHRVADFNQKTNVIGMNMPVSVLDRMAQLENQGTGHSPFYDYANATKGIIVNGSSYVTPLTPGETTNQDMQMSESGGINAWDFTFGGNYSHSFYFGMGLGVKAVNYERSSSYVETFENGGGIELRNALTTTGAGLDFKAGFIVRPSQALRLGLSYTSSTIYTLTDAYQASMASEGLNGSGPDLSHIGSANYVDYVVKTPSKITVSGSYVFEKKGLISFDLDYSDYRNSILMNKDGFEIREINDFIQSDFKANYSFRLGGEFRVSDKLSVRAGGAWYPTTQVDNLEALDIATPNIRPEYSMLKDTWYYSGGLGYRASNFFADVAVQEKISTEHFFNYFYQENNLRNDYASVSRKKLNLVLTCGLKF